MPNVRTVGDVMNNNIRIIPHDDSVEMAAKQMCAHNVGSLLVKQGGEIVGILTENDIVKKVLALEKDLKETKVNKVMTSPIITIDFPQILQDAHIYMANKGIRHLPVTKDGTIIGMVSARDLLSYI